MRLQRFMSDTLSFGKGSVKIPSADIIRQYKDKYDRLLARGLKFKISVYRLLPNNTVIIHTKVPSETVDEFYYDVLLELSSNGAKDFEECDIKIFSNCPSFVYTYAYVFYHLEDDEAKTKGLIIDQYHKKIPKQNLIITAASKKLTEEILHGKPIVRNPYGIPLFDKSIYYAIFNMVDRLDFNQTIYNKHLIRQKVLFDMISDFDTVMIKREQQDMKNKDRDKKAKLATESKLKKVEKKINTLNRGNSTKMVNKITSKKTNTIKPTKAISGIRSM